MNFTGDWDVRFSFSSFWIVTLIVSITNICTYTKTTKISRRKMKLIQNHQTHIGLKIAWPFINAWYLIEDDQIQAHHIFSCVLFGFCLLAIFSFPFVCVHIVVCVAKSFFQLISLRNWSERFSSDGRIN